MVAHQVTLNASSLMETALVPTATFMPPRVDVTPSLSSTTVPPLESPSLTSPPSSSNRSTCGAAVTTPRVVGLASDGSSPARQKQPLQIGYDTSPPSNSIQTAAPTSGTKKKPTLGPAYGTHSWHQPVGVPPSTEGTVALIRSVELSTSVTIPRYLPK